MTPPRHTPSLVKLERDSIGCTNYLRAIGVLDDVAERGRVAISAFYLYIALQNKWVASFDSAAASYPSKGWQLVRGVNPAMREKIRAIINRLTTCIAVADLDKVKGKDLLVDAQSALKKFLEQTPPTKITVYTGTDYLRLSDLDWLVCPPAVAYIAFVLFRKHSKPKLSKSKIYARIAHLLRDLFMVNIEADSIKKMISRFISRGQVRRAKRFLVKVENLT